MAYELRLWPQLADRGTSLGPVDPDSPNGDTLKAVGLDPSIVCATCAAAHQTSGVASSPPVVEGGFWILICTNGHTTLVNPPASKVIYK